MSSLDPFNDDFRFPMDSSLAEPMETKEDLQANAFEEFVEKPSEFSSSTEDNIIGFDDFFDTLDLPPVLKLTEGPPESTKAQEQVKHIQHPPAEMNVNQNELGKIQQETKALLKEANPPQPTGMNLLGCPFVLKLYLAASSDAMPMLNWSPSGRQLVVDYQALQDHLTAGSQIFRCRSVKQFTEKLTTEGFARVDKEKTDPAEKSDPSDDMEPMLLYYTQPEFVRGKLDALKTFMEDSLLMEKYYPMGAQNGQAAEDAEDEKELEFLVPLHMPSKSHLERMQQRGDKCCSIISVRSSIQAERTRFRTLLDHLATTQVLQASAHLCKNPAMKKSRPWDCPTFTSSSIKFVRPHDSVITLDPNKPPPEYAGYYGQVSPSMVNQFFGDFMPRYGNKTTGYKDIVLETTHKASNFQQNLPIGLAYSDGEDNDPDDFPPPASPAGQDSDMDSMPSTSAAAALRSSAGRKRGEDSLDDQELEEAMQELCGGSSALKENTSSSSRGKAKGPQQPKAGSRGRRAKNFESSSSESEAEVSRKAKKAKRETVKDVRKTLKTEQEEAIDNDEKVLAKNRGQSKAKTPKATSRKRLTSPNKGEAGSPKKRAKRGVQESRKAKKELEQLQQLEEVVKVELLAKKKPGHNKKELSEAAEKNADEEAGEIEDEDAGEIEEAPQDEVDKLEGEEYLDEEILEENEQPEDEDLVEELPEDDEPADDEPPEEDEQPEENLNTVENQEAEMDEDIEEDLDTEEDLEDGEDEEDEEDEEDGEDEEEEDAEDNEEDDDDDDYSVQYRPSAPEAEKPRRYHLRNSKGKSN